MKIQCTCGAKYAFEPTPEMARTPVKFVCPACGLDSSEIVNQLVQAELAEQSVPPLAPPPAGPVMPLKPGPARLKVPSAGAAPVPPPDSPPDTPAPAGGVVSKYCARHGGARVTEQCKFCGKGICPRCMELFGWFCSPRCRSQAEQAGMEIPEWAGQGAVVARRYGRRLGLILWAGAVVTVAALGFWTWYAWFGAVPHTVLAVRFADDDRAYAGGAELAGANQVVFLHGGTLARYDLATGKPVWSRDLIQPDEVAALVRQVQSARAVANAQLEDEGMAHTPPPGSDERHARIQLQNALTLKVAGEAIWVASPEGLTQYAWDTGRLVKVLPVAGGAVAGAGAATGGGLLSADGQPLDPDMVAEQAQSLNLPARIALPALLANSDYESKLEAALRDTDGSARRPVAAAGTPATVGDEVSLIGGPNGLEQFTVRLVQRNVVTREAMRAAPARSALNDPGLNAGQTAVVANEILNEMQRNRGGDTVTEDDSRYAVTVHQPGEPAANDWTGEVTGPPELLALATVNVVVAGETVIVLDGSNHQIWETTMTHPIPLNPAGKTQRFGAGPVVEEDGTLYIYDQAVLGAFAARTGAVRWRLPSVGIVGLFFDDHHRLYVNTTTGNPDDIKYSRQIDITKSTEAVLLKIDPVAGRILWSIKPGGYVAYLSGPYMYTLECHDPNPTDEEVLNDSLAGLEKPPYLRITRIDPASGRTLWDHEQDRCPVGVQFDANHILLIFKREVQVLQYLAW